MIKFHPAPERRRFLKGTLLSLATAAARRIGQEYLSRNDQIKRNRQALLMDLFDGAINADDLPAMAPAKIRRYLLKCIDVDYVSGNLTDIDGWMMARTEATLCSIFTLSLMGSRHVS